jgi:putative transposase
MSGKRFEILSNGEIYHVYNRSIAKENIFIKKRYCLHALELIEFYRFTQKMRFSFFKRLDYELKDSYIREYKISESLVSIYAYCLMPNHFHLLLKQNIDNGIKTFISNFQNSYGKYFNTISDRSGSVFQRPFKAKRITTEEEFMHVGRYIHLNPVSSYLVEMENIASYQWSSFPDYIKGNKNDLLKMQDFIKLAGSGKKYIKFVENNADYQRRLNRIKHLVFD